MFELFNQAKLDIVQNTNNAGFVFIIFIVIFLLIVGVPQILKGNLKGFIVSVIVALIASCGTFLYFFS
jgi:hypothetical protein